MQRSLSVVLSAISVCICVAVFWYFAPFVLSASDTGWLIRSGLHIAQTRSLPALDVFSWTSKQPWIIYQWFFEILVGWLFATGGLWFTGFVAYVVEGLIFFFWLPRIWMARGIPLFVAFVAIALSIAPPWFFVRPQLVSCIFILVFASILERVRVNKDVRMLWILPPLMVLWVNMHSLWFVGLLFVLAYAVTLKHKIAWAVLGACLLAVFVNPYGAEIIRYNLSFLSEPDFQAIGELRSVFSLGEISLYAFVVYAFLSAYVILKKWRTVPLAGIVLSALSAIAALRFARFVPVAEAVSWTYVGIALAQYDWSRFRNFAIQSWKIHFAVALLIPCLIWKLRVPTEVAAAEVFMNNDVEAMMFLLKHRTGDLWLNDPATGSHMILFGIGPVFIDNRFDMYGREFCSRWQQAAEGKLSWDELIEHNPKVGQAALKRDAAPGLEQQLRSDSRWLLIYDDGALAYWLTDTPEHRAKMNEWGLKELKKNVSNGS